MRALPRVRHIRPETICIGDTIKATVMNYDAEVSTVGTVARRERYSHHTEYLTAGGVVILEVHRQPDVKVTITLLNRAVALHPMLDGTDV